MSNKTALWAAGIIAFGYVVGSWVSSDISKTSGDARVDKWIKWFRDHRVIAPMLMVFIIIIALATLLGSIRVILEFIPWFGGYIGW